MSDPELATRAPESDLHEPSPISNTDSVAQSGPSLGEHCTTDRPAPADSSRRPSGQVTKYNDIDVYVSKPADYPNTPAKLLLLLSSGTGVHSANNQIQADIFAEHGFVVIMPDQFGGDPAPNSRAVADEVAKQPQAEQLGILERVKLTVADTAKSFLVDMWLARQTPEKVLPIVLKVIESARDEYADAIEHGGGIYSVGYCFGGKYTILLAGERPDTETAAQKPVGTDEEQGVVKNKPLIKAGAVAHATLVTREDLKGVKAPLSLVVVGEFFHLVVDVVHCLVQGGSASHTSRTLLWRFG